MLQDYYREKVMHCIRKTFAEAVRDYSF